MNVWTQKKYWIWKKSWIGVIGYAPICLNSLFQSSKLGKSSSFSYVLNFDIKRYMRKGPSDSLASKSDTISITEINSLLSIIFNCRAIIYNASFLLWQYLKKKKLSVYSTWYNRWSIYIINIDILSVSYCCFISFLFGMQMCSPNF